MKYLFLPIAILSIIVASCSQNQDQFLISKSKIGPLTDTTTVKNLKTIFKNDSIVIVPPSGTEFLGDISDIHIFQKNGEKLLSLTPKNALDGSSTIKTIQIHSPKYANKKGLNTTSAFGDITNNYKISTITKTLGSVIITVNEINAFFTIPKNNLPADLWFTENKIEAIQIPQNTKIGSFFIQW